MKYSGHKEEVRTETETVEDVIEVRRSKGCGCDCVPDEILGRG